MIEGRNNKPKALVAPGFAAYFRHTGTVIMINLKCNGASQAEAVISLGRRVFLKQVFVFI